MARFSKFDFRRSVSTNLPNSLVVKLDAWALQNHSDRSKVLNAIVTAVLTKIDEDSGFADSLESSIRRIAVVPKAGATAETVVPASVDPPNWILRAKKWLF